MKSIELEASCISMTVFEERGGDIINRMRNWTIFFGSSWRIEGQDNINPILFGYDVFYCYYSSNKNCVVHSSILFNDTSNN